jgi:hypothetical protein
MGWRRVDSMETCEHAHEQSGSKKRREFLYQLRNYQILKKSPAPVSCLAVKDTGNLVL